MSQKFQEGYDEIQGQYQDAQKLADSRQVVIKNATGAFGDLEAIIKNADLENGLRNSLEAAVANIKHQLAQGEEPEPKKPSKAEKEGAEENAKKVQDAKK